MKFQILVMTACTVQGCALETDVVKSGSNGQNGTSGAVKSVWVQMTGKHYFAFLQQ